MEQTQINEADLMAMIGAEAPAEMASEESAMDPDKVDPAVLTEALLKLLSKIIAKPKKVAKPALPDDMMPAMEESAKVMDDSYESPTPPFLS